jgi:hypothetical protein
MQFVSRGKGAWQWERKRNALVCAILEKDKYITRHEALQKANAMMGASQKKPKPQKAKAKPKANHQDHLHGSSGSCGDEHHNCRAKPNSSSKPPEAKAAAQHYHIPGGCAAEVRKVGTEQWGPGAICYSYAVEGVKFDGEGAPQVLTRIV